MGHRNANARRLGCASTHPKEADKIRIIAGAIKGRKLKVPLGLSIRPTPEKVRGAIFNILGARIVGAHFLDLFAGTGAVGIEALSRGAQAVSFVENNRSHLRTLKKNLLTWPSDENWDLFEMSAPLFLKQTNQDFDFVFLDPPYASEEIEKILPTLKEGDIIRPHGLAICEHFYKRILPKEIGGLHLIKQSQYGETVLSFYGKS